MQTNNCTNLHLFYDKYCTNNYFYNMYTYNIDINYLYNNLCDFDIFDNDNAIEKINNIHKHIKIHNLNYDIYCIHFYIKRQLPMSTFIVIGINIEKFENSFNDNLNIIKIMFISHKIS